MTRTAFSLRSLAAGSVLLLLVAPSLHAEEQTIAAPPVDARAWILMDYASGKVLAEGNADEKLDPASLTKIMTSYVVGQALKAGKIKLTDMVTVGKDAWATGNPALRGSSVMFLKPGDQVSVEDLNKGVIIQSGNDASIAIADYVAGSQDSFVDLMNSYGAKLGLTNTTFKTVHGLDAPGQFSTARDMALLTKAMIHDVPEEYAIHKEKEFTFNKIRQPNRNRLLWSTNINADGVKTGTTAGAGYNLVSSATQGDMRLIAVVLGTKTDRIRFNESEKLLTWGFRFYETVTPIKPDATFVEQRVWYGDSSNVKLGAGEAGSVTIPRGQLKNLKASFALNEPQLTAPLAKGQVVGTIDFKLNDKTIEQRPLVVMEEVKEGGFFSRMVDFVLMKFHAWFGSWFS
ncbi:MAG: serine-type D-Ala-D-Ala carboxypeptidase [Yokenella regensburgei]|jgi:D-alanyl-D-alanine carboxypeptidase (penicillin-binding protein 5/6)|nr:serine-type D-Ala-D-Ala carboxypeptidase [Yokenella regensburgei]KAF1371113.1 D-alanyl-D-alanine carboxypeptidase (penicillin-binding protein 5/6) [Yokenella regensburgei]KFD19332.1 D-alanyl-D-alanine carboxypeptidase [Yokenella regensburgei ATCC 49455]MDQ4431513.1 serine-type D-Ala-D-Ala carboxypeptidase [Yokenella regensburgei]MDR3104581.1 serine-type D-Ala-D-Ala carboxypeptidase [Yokenella regensburgei]QIU92176.1 serine-type D-Ala-D-Ala carboxypeptidase [Yokenella regensburgei]